MSTESSEALFWLVLVFLSGCAGQKPITVQPVKEQVLDCNRCIVVEQK